MITDVLILLIYILIARILIIKISTSWWNNIMGPVLGAIPLLLMNTGFVEDSFINMILALPAFFYLIFLSNRA